MSEAAVRVVYSTYTSDAGKVLTLRERLWREDGDHCHYCRQPLPLELSTIDHIVPRAFGGISARSNYVISCEPCNNRFGPAVRKCTCKKCERALAQHLQMAAVAARAPVSETAKISGVAAQLELLVGRLEETEAVLEELLAAGYEVAYDPEAAALAGKCKGLRVGIRYLRELT